MISESILEGQRLRLRPVQPGDLPKFAEWLGDSEVRRWLAAVAEAPTLQDEVEWYEDSRANPDNVLWSIETLDGRLIGTTELRVAPDHHRAELGIAIQDKTQWSQGYGRETICLLLEYGFEEMELNRIELTVDEANARARRCYEKCGFVREGVLRQHRFVEGEFGNTIVMSVLRSEWRGRAV
ncbi:MAG TPA: GNAT family protein [Dehalococcoidia bacterium]|nr:GNAT family protein [Dehalococcoidia bacterium]